MEANAKLYILKYDYIYYYDTITFTGNSADYGGAVFVDDVTNSSKCASVKKGEYFFQVLSLHAMGYQGSNIKSMNFFQNYANISGSTLYGGLLDRCAVSPFSEVSHKHNYDGESYFKEVSINTENTSISSLPV